MKSIKKINQTAEKIKTKQIPNEINLNDYVGKNILTYGTFDLLHEGHLKIIYHALEITEEKNIWVGVSSDNWNKIKGKKSMQTQYERSNAVKKKFPKINVFFEDHTIAEASWSTNWDDFKIDLIIMGGDHFENLSYINNRKTEKNSLMKIAFFERTPNISSTSLRKLINN